MSKSDHPYNRDYFERGIELGVSCYQNYRWLPELTIPMAMAIVDYLGIMADKTVLDFGCSKGFLVKALRLLRREAWGVDVSKYAIDNVDPAVKNYCFLKGEMENIPNVFDFCIAKDVFEHIPKEELPSELKEINARYLFAVIPLGDGVKYTALLNNCDVTHTICESKDWWIKAFRNNGWDFINFQFEVQGIKDHYYDIYPKAHGFFFLKNSRY